jgi:hypothetical protein
MTKHGLYLLKRPIELVSYGLGKIILKNYTQRYFEFDIKGRDNILPYESSVWVMNHTMCLDGGLTAPQLPKTHYWVQLEDPDGKGVLQNSVLSSWLWSLGFIRVSLTDKKTNIAAIQRSRDYLRLWHDHISIFPEGPTSMMDENHVLNNAAASIAIRNNRPLIAIGTDIDVPDDLRRYLWSFKRAVVNLGTGEEEKGTIQTIKDFVAKNGKIKYTINIRSPLRTFNILGSNTYHLVYGDPNKPKEHKEVRAKNLSELEAIVTKDAIDWCHQQQKRD